MSVHGWGRAPGAEPDEPYGMGEPAPRDRGDDVEFDFDRPAAEGDGEPRALDPRRGPSQEATRRLLAERRAERSGAPGLPPPPSRRGNGGSGGDGGTFRRRRVVAAVVGVLALVAVWFLFSLFQPFKGDGSGEVQVTIPEGSSVAEIGELLEEEGVVSSSLFFELRARLSGAAADLRSGDYTLAGDMSYGSALAALSAGAPDADILSLTVPEGLARSEIGPIVADAGLGRDYEQATIRSRLLDPADYGAEDADSLEGFLFPSTYELKPDAEVNKLVRKQLKAFQEEFEQVDMSAAEEANLTPYDVLTIASMVERESPLAEERPVVASVIYNRLREDIPLGIDATIRYATENWTEPIAESELAVDSPYNTYENAGLPPGPIGNPGIESIEAAANPEDTDYLFFVVKPGTCGEHEFTETLEEHEAAVARYEAERAARGGESPDDCPE